MTLEEIKQLVQVVVESGVAELEVTRGESRVRIRRSLRSAAQEVLIPAAASPASAPAPPNASPQPHAAAPAAAPAADESLSYVKSPIVGTFYEAPSPDAPPFVRVGDRVTPGQVLCIIESMKLMNEIEAEIAGTVVARLVENGSPVEYGEALFAIRPE
jgi:acetyl-CoA carboxylase biotin carboxyl carrier protein